MDYLLGLIFAWQKEAPRSYGGALLKVQGTEAVSCRCTPVKQPERAG